MEKKYKLIKSKLLTECGKPLFQIKALRTFGVVKKGDLGGFIESENNLSHDGNCWVYDNAQVYGNGEVSGDGKVFGYGQVFGNGKVYGNGTISGNGTVYGNGIVYGNGRVSGYGKVYGNGMVFGNGKVIDNDWVTNTFYVTGSKHAVCLSSYTSLTIGCHARTFKEWEETFEDVGKENEYTTEQIKEYGELIKFAIAHAPSVIERNRAKV